jgi:ribonuclease J
VAGRVYVDGISVGEVGEVVLRVRRALAKDGMFIVVVTVDRQNGRLVGKPEVVTRGFVSPSDEKLIAGSADRVAKSLQKPGDHFAEAGLLKAQVKDSLSAYLYQETKRRPLVFPVIVEV